MTKEVIPELKTIDLANGKTELIPTLAEVLNPELIGKAKHACLVWPFGPQDESGAAGSQLDKPSFEGKPGTLFVYLTDNADLYKTGLHDAVVSREHFNVLKEDYFRLFGLMLEMHEKYHVFGDYFGFSYCILDQHSEFTPIGCTDGFAVASLD